ncbi:response regulator transcription factor [Streptomyces sp. 8N706]|uniref:response regulator transcription factor n=1 Tax=Streptomyces sp. 8N706 TaxID=3457416 RepID=UPI003FD45E92
MSIATPQDRRLTGPAEFTCTAREFIEAADGDLICYWNCLPREDPLPAVLRDGGTPLWDRAGRVRIIYPTGALDVPRVAADAAWQQQRGAQVGLSSGLPPGAMLLTAAGAIVTTRPEGSDYAVIRDPAVLRALDALAELLWQRSDIVRAEPERLPTEAERQLLRMLVEGLTDQAVARRLGMSDRTVRRVVAQLMERLSAVSRFEAGVRAVERGWI